MAPALSSGFIVGGPIEAGCYLPQRVMLICNGKGKNLGLLPNRVNPCAKDYIAGTFFLCSFEGEHFASLTPVQQVEFQEYFSKPGEFMMIGTDVICGSSGELAMAACLLWNSMKNGESVVLTKLVNSGVTDFLSGMAEGTDTWASQAVLDLRKKNPALKLHCILLCREQADKWSASAQEVYCSILEQADSVVYVSRAYHKNCMLERNRFLADHAASLLAVYNGEWRGGAAATVRCAQRAGRKIIIIDPISRTVTNTGAIAWFY